MADETPTVAQSIIECLYDISAIIGIVTDKRGSAMDAKDLIKKVVEGEEPQGVVKTEALRPERAVNSLISDAKNLSRAIDLDETPTVAQSIIECLYDISAIIGSVWPVEGARTSNLLGSVIRTMDKLT